MWEVKDSYDKPAIIGTTLLLSYYYVTWTCGTELPWAQPPCFNSSQQEDKDSKVKGKFPSFDQPCCKDAGTTSACITLVRTYSYGHALNVRRLEDTIFHSISSAFCGFK